MLNHSSLCSCKKKEIGEMFLQLELHYNTSSFLGSCKTKETVKYFINWSCIVMVKIAERLLVLREGVLHASVHAKRVKSVVSTPNRTLLK